MHACRRALRTACARACMHCVRACVRACALSALYILSTYSKICVGKFGPFPCLRIHYQTFFSNQVETKLAPPNQVCSTWLLLATELRSTPLGASTSLRWSSWQLTMRTVTIRRRSSITSWTVAALSSQSSHGLTSWPIWALDSSQPNSSAFRRAPRAALLRAKGCSWPTSPRGLQAGLEDPLGAPPRTHAHHLGPSCPRAWPAHPHTPPLRPRRALPPLLSPPAASSDRLVALTTSEILNDVDFTCRLPLLYCRCALV